MYSEAFLVSLVLSIAGALIGLLVLWLVIYTAVRAALTSHREALGADQRFANRS
ncbi:hypothetical protein AB0N61_15855 [Microbacterium sp. NPDC089320]|uniref:hypothetical protein n=1 Tax=Microbacterium sp. NPDC089320 TaxID=3155182 RepID=UPI003439782B